MSHSYKKGFIIVWEKIVYESWRYLRTKSEHPRKANTFISGQSHVDIWVFLNVLISLWGTVVQCQWQLPRNNKDQWKNIIPGNIIKLMGDNIIIYLYMSSYNIFCHVIPNSSSMYMIVEYDINIDIINLVGYKLLANEIFKHVNMFNFQNIKDENFNQTGVIRP